MELTDTHGQPGDHLYLDDVQVTPGANHLDGDSAGFEATLGRWTPWYSAEISRTTGVAASGLSSARVDVKAPHGWGVQLDNWPGFPASPGVRSIGFWGCAGTGSKLGATMTLRWRNEAGTTLQIEQVTIPVLSGSWQEARALVTAPAGTARVHVDFSHGSGRSGDPIYLDGIHAGS